MTTHAHIQACIARACDTFERRPSAAVQDDSPAIATWDGALGTQLMSPVVAELRTDMPVTLGGGGAGPSPGWYFRAGVASCMVTSIAMEAAKRAIVIERLEVQACSVSDARGMLGMSPEVPAGPLRFSLKVTLEAGDTPPDTLCELVASAHALAPMSDALRRPIDVTLDLQLVTNAGA